MQALHDLVQAGKVRYLGASSMRGTQFAQLQFLAEKYGLTKFISMQNYYNLCYREEEREMVPYCKETCVGLIPWSPRFLQDGWHVRWGTTSHCGPRGRRRIIQV